MSHNHCQCGPISAARGLKHLMLTSSAYFPANREPANIKEARNPDIEEMLDCWADCRTAIKGSRAVKSDARERHWLEFPQHISVLMEIGSDKQRKAAEKAAYAYVERASYDNAVRRCKNVVVGSVMRKDIAVEGVADGIGIQAGRLTQGDLDSADSKGRTLKQFGEFLLDEKATTRYTAIYTYMTENSDGQNRGGWKVYTAENIWNPLFVGGKLVHIVFREHEPLNSSNRFERHKTQEIFRELSLEQVGETEANRVIERIWRPVRDAKGNVIKGEYSVSTDQIIMVRDRNLTEIPVVIDGGPLPEQPMFQDMCEITQKRFGLSAKIEYRLHKIAHPTPHLNFTGNANDSFIVTGPRNVSPSAPSNGQAVKQAMQNSGQSKAAIIPGTLFQTQNAEFNYIYDTGAGIDHLFAADESCKKDLEAIGANYGITTNNSNIAEGTERLRQGKETAFIISHIASSSEALTQSARWLAVFNGVTSEDAIFAINLDFNLCLNDDGPVYTLTDTVNLLREGALPRIIIIRMIRGLLPNTIIPDDITDEAILEMIEREENAAVFGNLDVDE